MTMRWQRAKVALEETHHVLEGEPLYDARFLQVLKFHAPGLAPALDATGAYHVDERGRATYAARYRRTFGFYEGVAAVDSGRGWMHIRPDGQPLNDERFAWCGNFQESRCPVRDLEGRYFHLREDGVAAYPERYGYAGDFRDGVAVVQAEDGRHTHIDAEGRALHGRWFLDLDVFHKGLARARDEEGWHHVDRHARPVYGRRFAMVEPFYNGQARVQTLEMGLQVIGEDGATVLELPVSRSQRAGQGLTTNRMGR